MTGKDVVIFECELTVYRRGSLLVRVNLEQGTMIWKDSRQWCNNFVRTLTDDQVSGFYELISLVMAEENRLLPDTDETTAPAGSPENIMLTLCGTSEKLVLCQSQIDALVWTKLRRAIERLSKTPFRL